MQLWHRTQRAAEEGVHLREARQSGNEPRLSSAALSPQELSTRLKSPLSSESFLCNQEGENVIAGPSGGGWREVAGVCVCVCSECRIPAALAVTVAARYAFPYRCLSSSASRRPIVLSSSARRTFSQVSARARRALSSAPSIKNLIKRRTL